MATKAFQKIYTKITQITKATCSLKATGVGYDELATVNGKLAQVVKIAGDDVTLQVFEGTEGIHVKLDRQAVGGLADIDTALTHVDAQSVISDIFILCVSRLRIISSRARFSR